MRMIMREREGARGGKNVRGKPLEILTQSDKKNEGQGEEQLAGTKNHFTAVIYYVSW
jgi:hypothetical protein